MANIKEQYHIPYNMQSCHTMVINNYALEGHIPIEAITKLLEEQPAIDGIALPGMPAGSPGMPGVKTEPFAIYTLANDQTNLFMTL